MRRLCPLLLVALSLAAAPPPRIAKPKGLVAGDTSASAAAKNTAAIQTAIDAAASPGRVVLPEGDYYTLRPIHLDRPGVGIEGEGRGITRLISLSGHDVLAVAICRTPNAPGAAPLTPDHFPDLADGPLEGFGRGQRYAFRTRGDHHLAQQGGPLDDFPAGVRALTLDLAVDLTRLRDAGGTYARASQTSLCGMASVETPSPWSLAAGNDAFAMRIASASGQVHAFTFGIVPKVPGFVRLTVQIDLAAGTVGTWIDDRAVPNTARLPKGFAEFAANQHCPFGIGATAERANRVADYYGGPDDLTFHGLRVTLAPVYRPDGPLRRLDGKPLTDGRYFTLEAATRGFLGLTDTPEQMAASRVANVTGRGYAGSTAYVLDNVAHDSNWSSIGAGPIRGLSLSSLLPYGRAIAVGFALGLDVRDCEALGGRGGIASINFGSNYPVLIRDCSLGGSDSPLYLFMSSSAIVERVELPRQFRVGVRLVHSSARITGLFAPAWSTSDAYVRSVASSFTLEDSSWDNEGDGGPRVAPIVAVPGGAYPTIITIRRSGFAVYPGPFAVLDELAAPDKMPLRFTVEDCPDILRGDLGSGRIDVKGNRWKVTRDW